MSQEEMRQIGARDQEQQNRHTLQEQEARTHSRRVALAERAKSGSEHFLPRCSRREGSVQRGNPASGLLHRQPWRQAAHYTESEVARVRRPVLRVPDQRQPDVRWFVSMPPKIKPVGHDANDLMKAFGASQLLAKNVASAKSGQPESS